MIFGLLILLLCMGLIPLGVVLTTLAFDQPNQIVCRRCRYDMRGLPTRTCPECGCINLALGDTAVRLRHRLLFVLGVLCFLFAIIGGPLLFAFLLTIVEID